MGGGGLRWSMHPQQIKQIPPLKSPSFSTHSSIWCRSRIVPPSSVPPPPSPLSLFPPPSDLFFHFPFGLLCSPLRGLGVSLCKAPLRSVRRQTRERKKAWLVELLQSWGSVQLLTTRYSVSSQREHLNLNRLTLNQKSISLISSAP